MAKNKNILKTEKTSNKQKTSKHNNIKRLIARRRRKIFVFFFFAKKATKEIRQQMCYFWQQINLARWRRSGWYWCFIMRISGDGIWYLRAGIMTSQYSFPGDHFSPQKKESYSRQCMSVSFKYWRISWRFCVLARQGPSIIKDINRKIF